LFFITWKLLIDIIVRFCNNYYNVSGNVTGNVISPKIP
jgi:hypothetical protein